MWISGHLLVGNILNILRYCVTVISPLLCIICVQLQYINICGTLTLKCICDMNLNIFGVTQCMSKITLYHVAINSCYIILELCADILVESLPIFIRIVCLVLSWFMAFSVCSNPISHWYLRCVRLVYVWHISEMIFWFWQALQFLVQDREAVPVQKKQMTLFWFLLTYLQMCLVTVIMQKGSELLQPLLHIFKIR